MTGFTFVRLPEPGNWDITVDGDLAFQVRGSADNGARVTDCRHETSQRETGATGHWCELDALVHCVRLLANL